MALIANGTTLPHHRRVRIQFAVTSPRQKVPNAFIVIDDMASSNATAR